MKIHRLQGYIQNIFLVEYADKLLLLDGASRADVPLLEQFVTQQLGRPFKQLKLVLVTHMHPDHAGAASILQRRHQVSLACADCAGEWYQGWRGRARHLLDLGLAYYVGRCQGRPWVKLWYPPVLRPDERLSDGQCLPGFADWQVLFSPGHTDRDLSLYHPQTKTLYVADSILRIKGKLVPPFPISLPEDYCASLNRFAQLEVEQYLLAHGEGGSISAAELQQLVAECPQQASSYRRFLGSLVRKRWFKLS